MNAQPCKTRSAWNEPGHAHFLTYSCYQRLPLLTRDRTRHWIIEALENVRQCMDVALWAFVIMPEHVHVVLHPRRDQYEMKHILAALKRPVAVKARNFLLSINNLDWLNRLTVSYPSRRVFRFWQPGGGHDHNIFRTRTVSSVIDYVHANPVRRGLVNHPEDWVWSSARFWGGSDDVLLAMDHPRD
jgi:putative transposase